MNTLHDQTPLPQRFEVRGWILPRRAFALFKLSTFSLDRGKLLVGFFLLLVIVPLGSLTFGFSFSFLNIDASQLLLAVGLVQSNGCGALGPLCFFFIISVWMLLLFIDFSLWRFTGAEHYSLSLVPTLLLNLFLFKYILFYLRLFCYDGLWCQYAEGSGGKGHRFSQCDSQPVLVFEFVKKESTESSTLGFREYGSDRHQAEASMNGVVIGAEKEKDMVVKRVFPPIQLPRYSWVHGEVGPIFPSTPARRFLKIFCYFNMPLPCRKVSCLSLSLT